MYPLFFSLDYSKVYVGDNTLSVLEIWGAEYQENNALLILPSSEAVFREIAERENCPIRILGTVTGDGRVVVRDSSDGTTPVDLPLELVLGKMPQKTFTDSHLATRLEPLNLPGGTTVRSALARTRLAASFPRAISSVASRSRSARIRA